MYSDNRKDLAKSSSNMPELRQRFGPQVKKENTLRETIKRGGLSLQQTIGKIFSESRSKKYKSLSQYRVSPSFGYLMFGIMLFTIALLFPLARSVTLSLFYKQQNGGAVPNSRLTFSNVGQGHDFEFDGLHAKIRHSRPTDVINHRYDDIGFSILLNDNTFFAGTSLHQSILTFLRQVNYLQVCNDQITNNYIGGVSTHVSPFILGSQKSIMLERYADAYVKIYQNSPSRDWYLQLDEETYIFLENIQVALNGYPKSDAIFIHNFDLIAYDAVRMPNIDNKHHFPISILSHAALKMLIDSDYVKCFSANQNIPSMQTIFVKCLEEVGIKIIRDTALHITEPTHDFNWNKDPCARPLAISQMSSKNMDHLHRSRPITGLASSGNSYKWDSIVNYSDVFHHTFATSDFSVGIARNAGTKAVISEAESGIACLNQCKERDSCISWTYERPKCFLSDSVGVVIPREGAISGIISTRYNCK